MEFKRDKKLQELIAGRNNHLIKIVTGLRRCGKSYLLNDIFSTYLINEGFNPKNIIKFAFDFDEDIDKLNEFYPDEPTKIKIPGKKDRYIINSKKFRKYIEEKTNNDEEFILLLDEVQLLKNFVGTLNGFLKHKNYDVYVTGSNSRFLSSDVATDFRGRGDVIHLEPLSFKEIYDVVGGDKYELLDDYLRFGGLPLCVLEKTEEKKIRYLDSVYKTIYLNDLKERNDIKKEVQFEELLSVLSSNIGSLVSADKLSKTFSSMENDSVEANTIKRYMKCYEDAYLINTVKRYDVKGKKYISAPVKCYFEDLGVRNTILNFRQIEKNHLMENLIYNELKRRGFLVDVGCVEKYEQNSSGTYSKKNLEVDFVANKGYKRYYIQSAFSIDDENKRIQEERPFDQIGDSFQKVLIVYDNVKPYQNEKGYIVIGLLNFLLDEDSLF